MNLWKAGMNLRLSALGLALAASPVMAATDGAALAELKVAAGPVKVAVPETTAAPVASAKTLKCSFWKVIADGDDDGTNVLLKEWPPLPVPLQGQWPHPVVIANEDVPAAPGYHIFIQVTQNGGFENLGINFEIKKDGYSVFTTDYINRNPVLPGQSFGPNFKTPGENGMHFF